MTVNDLKSLVYGFLVCFKKRLFFLYFSLNDQIFLFVIVSERHHVFHDKCSSLCNIWFVVGNDQPSLTAGFRRLLPAEYEDGIGVPKGGFPFLVQTNRSLPSARFISQQITKQNLQWKKQEFGYSDLFTAFGQFMSHDFRHVITKILFKPYQLLLYCHMIRGHNQIRIDSYLLIPMMLYIFDILNKI